MSTIKRQGHGRVIQHTNVSGTAIASDDIVHLGDQGLVGIAEMDIANAASGSVELAGGIVAVYDCKGHNGNANTAIDIYDKVYHTAGEAFFDVDSVNGTFVGYALGAVTSGATTSTEVLLSLPIA